MSDEPKAPVPVEKLANDQSQQNAAPANSTGSSFLTVWKKPGNVYAYYGPPPHTYLGDEIKENPTGPIDLPTPLENGYSVPGYRPPQSVPTSDIAGPTRTLSKDQGATTHPGPTLAAVKDGKVKPVCQPHLQILCGPLLKYDTVLDGVWRGAVLVVTNDSESIYNPTPTLTVEWESEACKPFEMEGGGGAGDAAMEQPVRGSESGVPLPGTSREPSSTSSTDIPPTPPPKSPLSSSESDESSSSSSNSDKATSPSSTVKSKDTSQGSASGSWAKSMFSKFKNIKATSPGGDFRGRPPERIARTAAKAAEDEANKTRRIIEGEPIFKYAGVANTSTFWRFLMEIPLNENPDAGLAVKYTLNKFEGSVPITFHIASANADLRWAAYSCNGFSAGVDPDKFKGEAFESGFDPVWADLLQRHEERPLHVLIGGGDQIYCDPLMNEPEMQEYVNLTTHDQKLAYPLTDAIKLAMDRFYFNHYCMVFRNGCFGRAISEIPMINMCDDHDLIDGFGSYPDDLQRSPFFKHIGSRGYFWFLLFQQFTVDSFDGTLIEPGQHTFKSTIIGADGPYIPFPSHTSLHYFGPKTWTLMLDCRAERRKNMVLTPETYQQVFGILRDLPKGVEHLIIQLGIPIAYPRMNFAEKVIHSDSFLAKMAKAGYQLPGFSNKYNKDMELLDDLSDHWTAKHHKKERNWFILKLQELALEKHVRISFISGDVHLAAVGLFKTWPGKLAKVSKNGGVEPAVDHRWMVNIVSSGIVNTPPPPAAQTMVNLLSGKKHRTLHYADTDEVMIPVFEKSPTGTNQKFKYTLGARNYTIGERDPATGEYVFDIRIEKAFGAGETKGYTVRAPPPKWGIV